MPEHATLDRDLREATLDDVGIVADLETLRDPSDPRDPEMLRFWWTRGAAAEVVMRRVAVRDGAAVAFVGAGHESWDGSPKRFGWIRPALHPDLWTDELYLHLVGSGEEWLQQEGAAIAVTRTRGDRKRELDALNHAGYAEVRQQWIWELDLIAGRGRLLDTAQRCRARMRDEAITLLTVSEDRDPAKLNQLHELFAESERDIPTTMPWRTMQFGKWKRFWFDNPGTRPERFWIAREGPAIVGLSVLEFPPTRGIPWTAFTGTSRSVRGRGIARALKYETIVQAIELGSDRVRTANDSANAPILHLNQEMGYQMVTPMIELHHELRA